MKFALKEFVNSTRGRYVFSILLGLGLATFFRKACSSRDCLVFKAPSFNDIKKNIYKHNNNCYKFTERSVTCNNSNTNKGDKLFRYNLGIPLPLYLIQNEGKKIEKFFNDENIDKKTKIKDKKCIGKSLFDDLFDLQKYTRKIPKTRKRKRKGKKKTRKKSFF